VFGTEGCFLLHSRFVPEDRKKREREVLDAFSGSKKCCVITTQVCEVGLDISCDVLLTEVSPIDSLIQRVGRCARRGGKGEVYVFDVKGSKPYEDRLIRATYREVENLQNKVLRWDMEKELVNKLLSNVYYEALSTVNYGITLQRLVKASFKRDRRKVEEAVRDAFTCKLTIHKDPESVGRNVFKLPVLSLDVKVLRGFYRRHEPRLWYVNVKKADYEGVRSQDVEILEIRNITDIVPYAFFVAHPNFLYYDEYFGLYFGEQGKSFYPLNRNKTNQYPAYEYKKELWVQHAEKALNSLEKLLNQYFVEIGKISKVLNIERSQFNGVMALSVALHDIGKLNRKWQKAADASTIEPLAHTESTEKNLPHHSAISAYSLKNFFKAVAKDVGSRELWFVCMEAIAHHHHVGTEIVEPYEFIKEWKQLVEKLTEKIAEKYPKLPRMNCGLIRSKIDIYEKLPTKIPSLDSPRTYIPYTFISRLLRLSDRRSLSG
jgi:CRISPR-associated endonuclease/helicase Cas3